MIPYSARNKNFSWYLELRVNLSDHVHVKSIQNFGSVYSDNTCTANFLQKNIWFCPIRHLVSNENNRTLL